MGTANDSIQSTFLASHDVVIFFCRCVAQSAEAAESRSDFVCQHLCRKARAPETEEDCRSGQTANCTACCSQEDPQQAATSAGHHASDLEWATLSLTLLRSLMSDAQ